MPTLWLKVDVGLLQNPKVMQAGKDGALVYLQALALSVRGERDGLLTEIESRPEIFAALLAAYKLRRRRCARAIQSLVDAGLLRRVGNRLQIRGAVNAYTIRASRTRKARDLATHTAEQWKELVTVFGHRCLKCGGTERLQKDHVVPISSGGSDGIDNLQPLCARCNSSKGSRIEDYRPRWLSGGGTN